MLKQLSANLLCTTRFTMQLVHTVIWSRLIDYYQYSRNISNTFIQHWNMIHGHQLYGVDSIPIFEYTLLVTRNRLIEIAGLGSIILRKLLLQNKTIYYFRAVTLFCNIFEPSNLYNTMWRWIIGNTSSYQTKRVGSGGDDRFFMSLLPLLTRT